MPSIAPPNVVPRAFHMVSKLAVAGLILSACAGCSIQTWVPAGDLEAERQQRKELQARQKNLQKEIKKQIVVQGKLEDRLVAEGQERRKLEVRQRQLQKQIAAHNQERQSLDQRQAQLERELKQQFTARDTLYEEIEELERQLSEEDVKREEWKQWQEQLERDLVHHSTGNSTQVDGVAAESEKQFAEKDLNGEEWSFWVEEEDLKAQSTAREALDYGDANLYLLLLEKKAYIARLAEEIEKVISEVVRAKAKLRSLESKAEAASNLAEAEIAVESLKARGQEWKNDPSVIKAEQLTRLSAREFEEGNYGGALYLTSQAKSLIEGARARSKFQEKSPTVEGEVPFLLPLTLRLLNKSNVRKGPGLNYEVVFSWEDDTALIAHAFKGQWVRVTNERGQSGWVFYKSVGSN